MTTDTAERAIAVVGLGAILPDAPDVATFWSNLKSGRYSISETPRERWDPAVYYDADPKAPDKTYSKIGGWVRQYEWNPVAWKLPIPPRVSDQMDLTQKWAVAAARQALADFGWPQRPLDSERTAVVLGNAMAGDRHYFSAMRILFPELAEALAGVPSFAELPRELRERLTEETRAAFGRRLPEITEDTMPGELANIIAGRVANLFNFNGPNFVTDAACASALAALDAASEGLISREYDAVLTGGIDANMSAATFTKFCKIGALSATGTRPYADGADGFVMGEGAAVFLLKRLADAEAAGDRIYAVLRGVGGSSDGRGKGITAPNPAGQRFAVARGWENAGLSPATVGLVEGHGTSTRVGDVAEVESLNAVFGGFGLAPRSVPLGSVKSNIGHLKAAAGAAGLLKAVLSLHDKVLPPSLNCQRPNPNIDFAATPFFVNTELRPWEKKNGTPRRACVSAFGFGGTNFHVVLEEFQPGALRAAKKTSAATGATAPSAPAQVAASKAPLRGALLLGAADEADLAAQLKGVREAAQKDLAPERQAPAAAALAAPLRLAIGYADARELAVKSEKALAALEGQRAGMWRVLRAQGVFRWSGPPAKVAFLYTGQGSQYLNMGRELAKVEPIVAETFAQADRVMTPLLGRPLTDILFVDERDSEAFAKAEELLRQTAITQPAVLSVDIALTRLFAAYGIQPDFVMGHSLGEYGALVASGCLSFEEGLEAVSARGREMTRVSVGDNGRMVAVFAPLAEIERALAEIDGYVVVANINSTSQAVIGGATEAVERAAALLSERGFECRPLPVSHAFHTQIVAPASAPLKVMLTRLKLSPPRIPIVSNATGEFYPMGEGVVPEMMDLLGRQIAEPVQFVKGLETLYGAGARVFAELGPKRALQGFVEDVLGGHKDMLALFTNHPKNGDVASFNGALCGLYATGHGAARGAEPVAELRSAAATAAAPAPALAPAATPAQPALAPQPLAASAPRPAAPAAEDRYQKLGQLFANFLERAFEIYSGAPSPRRAARSETSVVVTGAALGLPGTERVFDDGNLARMLAGEQFIRPVPETIRQQMVDKRIIRLVKSEAGGPRFDVIASQDEVIKLAARAGSLDLERDFGFAKDRLEAFDRTTELAIGAGIDALRDAGIPMVLRYKTTTTGGKLPDRWGLPEELRDSTGVIFASAFPGYDRYAAQMEQYREDQVRRARLAELQAVRARVAPYDQLAAELDGKIAEIAREIAADPYQFDRRFLFQVLAMGHSQFAEAIGARGPNTQINSACASTTQAFALAEDWIRAGRCERVVVIAADDITSDHLLGWFGSGFLASGAAATDARVEDAALPFDRRRHGMLIGMGAAAAVIESAEAAQGRGLAPICELLGTVTANSAFHGSRLDVGHIGMVMENLVAGVEARWGLDRHAIAAELVFVSHETYTPARGGSAQAEIDSLRRVFGRSADKIVIANAKGQTGHPMGVGIEDVMAVKALETGLVPPVPNIKEIDPELGALNISRGGAYPIRYALRLGAGFGSQVSMSLLRWVPAADGRRRAPQELGFAYRVADPAIFGRWLARVANDPQPQLEVDHRTLRVVDRGLARQAAPAATAPAQAVSPQAVPAPLAPPMAATPAAAAAAPAADPVQEAVLALVAEKTGYAREMLALDLDLEADLGIDTVKQAEMFAAIRERYGIERDPNLKLRDFNTLAKTVQFVYDRRPDLARPAASAPAFAAALPPAADEVVEAILELVAEKTGYAREMLALDLDLEADLGIDTVKQAEMFAAIRERYGIERDPNLKLRDFNTLAKTVQFVYDRRPDLARPAATAAAPPATPAPAMAPAFAQPRPSLTSPSFAAPTAASAPAARGSDEVQETVLALVSEKTGYPREMLDLDLDLEADLGVDTVKQAEMFAAIRERYGIERDPNLKLRDFNTLAKTMQFVYDRRPDLARPATTPATAPVVPVIATHSATAHAFTPPQPFLAQPASGPAVAGAPAPSPALNEVQETVLALVSEKTGYPREMLDLDLDLEADLGVDTVKQAEMFAAIRERYGIERDPNLKLRDFNTLAKTMQFVYDRRPELAPGAAPAAAAALPATAAPAPSAALAASPAEVARFPRRVPVVVPRPTLELCKPTGAALAAGSRVVLVGDHGGVGQALAERLAAEGVEVLAVPDRPSAEELVARLESWRAGGPIGGLYWLPALDPESDPAAMELAGWREALRARVKLFYTALRTLYAEFDERGFVVAATRLGGAHGYDEQGALAPLGGAVVGLAKSFARERPAAVVKAVDFGLESPSDEIARLLLDETRRDPGALEIGYLGERRIGIGLAEQPFAFDIDTPFPLGREPVFVVTGAAGSIVSAILQDLAAQAPGANFHLLDLAAAPDPADPDLARFHLDREGLKRDLFARLQARGERATPALVERELAKLERQRAALDAMEAIAASGGRTYYHALDLRDGAAVAAAIADVRARHGRIDVLVHAGGIEISRLLPDKKAEEYDLVFDIKADGWFNLISAIGDMPLGAAVVFSSIAGRFGNVGQGDYSAANDLLVKLMSNLRRVRPGTRGIAIDWTGWAGIGMASRGSIPKLLEAAGIDLLPAALGISWLRRELTESAPFAEVVVAGRLGVMLESRDADGGLDLVANGLAARVAARPLVGGAKVRLDSTGRLVVETRLDPREQPFLDDHRIDGTPVLPGVMGIEAFAEVASLLFPEFAVAAVEEVEFLAPFKFYKDEPRTVRVEARFALAGDGLVADCELTGERQLPGQAAPQRTVHFRGRVRLGRAPVAGEAPPRPAPPDGPQVERGAIYRVYFHGPAYQVLAAAWRDRDIVVGALRGDLPPNHRPEELPTWMDPRAIELCFQTAGVGELGTSGRFGLPLRARRVVRFAPVTAGSAFALARSANGGGETDVWVLDGDGRLCLLLEGYATVELPGGADETSLAPFRAALEVAIS